ncbi:MAG: hypothetical protein AB7G47_11050 [Mycolicibacterium sp.]
MKSWFKATFGAKFGAIRASTVALIVAFSALFWVHQTFQPDPRAEMPVPAVVPPGFVPDPNYTWVPRTNVRTGAPEYTTTTDTTTTTTTTSPTETTSPGETTTPTSTPESTSTSPTTTTSGTDEPKPQTTPAPATTSARPETPATVPPR